MGQNSIGGGYVPPKKKGNGALIAVLVILLLAIFALAGYILWNENKTKTQEENDLSVSVSSEQDADEEPAQADVPAQPEPVQPEPFYGIWCGAYNTQEDAVPMQAQLEGCGFPAKIHLTTCWSGLNAAPYYVVTAGEYASLEEAEAALPQVQKDFPDAYIKYTGQWQEP